MPVSADKNRPRKKRTSTWVRVAKKDRRNLKLWAEGVRESILRPHLAAYTDALERGWRAERDYLLEVCREFHAKISWRLEDHEEPVLPLAEYDPFASVIVEDLGDEELVQKRTRVDQMNARIARWLKYRARRLKRPTRMDRTKDPWSILLAKLAGINSPPKARQAFQQYMHESYESEIQPTVEARWAASPAEDDGQTMKSKKGPDAPFRAKVARELFAELSSEDQEGLRERAKEEAKTARDRYAAAMKNGPSKAPEDRQRCIDNLGAFMAAILRGVYEYTGLSSVAVFGGPMPQYGGELRTLHCAHGRNHGSPPTLFPAWSQARFNRDVLDFMREWLGTAYTALECTEAALVVDGESAPLYTITPDLGFPEDSDDDSEDLDEDGRSTESGSSSDSDIDSDMERDVRKKGKKVQGRGNGKGKGKEREKVAEKRSGKQAQKESGETGAKRKRGNDVQGSKKRGRLESDLLSSSAAPPIQPMAPDDEERLTYDQQRERQIARNQDLLREVDAAWDERNPEMAARIAEDDARRGRQDADGKKKRAETKEKSKQKAKAKAMAQVAVPVRRSERRTGSGAEASGSGGSTGGGLDTSDVEMSDATDTRADAQETAMEPRVPMEATPGPTPAAEPSTPSTSRTTTPELPAGAPTARRAAASAASGSGEGRKAGVGPAPAGRAPPPSASTLNAMGGATTWRVPPRPLHRLTSLRPPHPLAAPPLNAAGSGGETSARNLTPTVEMQAVSTEQVSAGATSGGGETPDAATDRSQAGSTSGKSAETLVQQTGPTSMSADTLVQLQWDDDKIPACPDDAAAWFKATYPEVSGELSGKRLGGSFSALLAVFIEVERGYGWKTHVKGLHKIERPTETDIWINGARGGRGGAIAKGVGPEIVSVVVYEERWWRWWGKLQPKWRKEDGGKPGRFARDEYPPPGNAESDWEALRYPGQNGFLTVVATLYWWGMRLAKDGGEEERQAWREGVTDVQWMLMGLLRAQKEMRK